MNKILFAQVNNKPEVLMRITGLLRRKGFDMKGISMMQTSKPSLAYITIMTEGENEKIQQAIHQIEKNVDVYTAKMIEEFSEVQSDWYVEWLNQMMARNIV